VLRVVGDAVHPGSVCQAVHEASRAILDCLGLPSRAPPVSPAKLDPTDHFEKAF